VANCTTEPAALPMVASRPVVGVGFSQGEQCGGADQQPGHQRTEGRVVEGQQQ